MSDVPTTPETPKLDAYHLDEGDWESYDQLVESFEWEIPDEFNIATYICDRWAEADPDRTALYIKDDQRGKGEYTFGEIQTAANRLANYFESQGIGRGDRIGVNVPQKAESVIGHVAAWKLGAVSVPLSTLFGTEGLRYRLDDSGASACLIDESTIDVYRSVADDLDDLGTVLTVGDVAPADGETDFWDTLEGYSDEFETVTTNAEDDLTIFYTSGTTGDPKGVRHAHRMHLGHLPLFSMWFTSLELTDNDVYWTPASWTWMGGLGIVVLPAMYYGKPTVGWNDQFEGEDVFGLVEEYGITNYWIPPTALRMMMQNEEAAEAHDLSSVRTITSGGESLGQTIVDWVKDTFAGADIHEGYGQTEANMLVGGCMPLDAHRPGKIGKAAPGQEVRILDPDTAEPTVEPGEVGEIGVRYEGNPVCFKQYWNKPEKTNRKVRNGWLLTEDLGTVDEDGYLEFVSRKDDVIISSGYRIGPEEIEDSLAGHDAVADAGVIGVTDDERGEVPKAYVTLAAEVEPSDSLVDELQQHVKDRLAKYEYPRHVEFIDELPRTATGKIRRTALEDRQAEG
ncbi:AMP-dependent synthetase [Haloglomus irregulare]|jgi:acetyl-CoA synthetase|uniref:AMP-dependent synthetase n=1 Tax=Haloglomus irregulare TaxID=2234134 RepID=A0A554MWF3_9EURY|nr:AMP-binding protein [Haloglomus irregulare]TSD09140.1 AMP-dependent synthetase [Haloglomus irregulare]